MKINVDQLQRAIEIYFNQEVLSKAVGFKKFTTALMFNMYKPKLGNIINALAENSLVKMADLFDEQRFINVDALYNYAKDAIQKSGQFETMGIIFTENDIDKLYSIIRTQIQGG